ATLQPAAKFKPIVYPRPDGVVSFDKLSSVFLSNTNHEEDQPVHLLVKDMALQKASEHDVYGGPSPRSRRTNWSAFPVICIQQPRCCRAARPVRPRWRSYAAIRQGSL